MEIHVAEQGLTFLGMLLCGVGFGLLFDFFRAVRKLIPMNGLWVNVTDLVFWIVCTVMVFVTARVTNRGELRWYEFIGLFSGTGLYFLLLGSLVVPLFVKVLRMLVKGTVLVLRVVSFPVRILLFPVKWVIQATAPFRRKMAFCMSVRRQKWLFNRKQIKKILKTPKIF